MVTERMACRKPLDLVSIAYVQADYLTIDLVALPKPYMTIAGQSIIKVGYGRDPGQERTGVFGQWVEVKTVDCCRNRLPKLMSMRATLRVLLTHVKYEGSETKKQPL